MAVARSKSPRSDADCAAGSKTKAKDCKRVGRQGGFTCNNVLGSDHDLNEDVQRFVAL